MANRDENNDETLHSQRDSSLTESTAFGSETSKASARKSLPPPLQGILDQAYEDESIYEDSWAQKGTESNKSLVRYAAYASRLKTILYSMQRYAAYAYGLSRSFEPRVHHSLIRGAHAISWGYILGDAAREARMAYSCNHQVTAREVMGTNPGTTSLLEDPKTVAIERVFFHGMASMALPALTIRHIVKHTTNAMTSVKSKSLRAGGPLGLILLTMPFFPYIVDRPVEDAVEWIFYKGFQTFWGQAAVGTTSPTGRSEQLHMREMVLKERKLQLEISQ